jgi:hypothetical protein
MPCFRMPNMAGSGIGPIDVAGWVIEARVPHKRRLGTTGLATNPTVDRARTRPRASDPGVFPVPPTSMRPSIKRESVTGGAGHGWGPRLDLQTALLERSLAVRRC